MSTHDERYAEVLPGVDPTRPTIGRLYDWFLNGRQWYEADEKLARRLIAKVPESYYTANANRNFLQRAVGAMARAGIRQFIDCGAGIPTQWNTHEVAQNIHPEARVAYVDIDEAVLIHSKALIDKWGLRDTVRYIQGDIREPAAILEHREVRDLIDFTQPIGLVHVAIWHFVPDSADPLSKLRQYLDAVPSGSYLALSHFTADNQNPEKVQRWLDVLGQTPTPVVFRTREEIDRFFDGLEYLPPYEGAAPGLSFVDIWGGKNPSAVDPAHTWIPCGVARKP